MSRGARPEVVSIADRTAHLRPAPGRVHEAMTARTARRAEDLLARHGRSAYALACALLRDEAAATRAVALAITDLVRSTEASSTAQRRALARHVYWRCQDAARETTGPRSLPTTMVRLGQLARLQRASLALCVFGGHTHREAADLLGVPALTVAVALTSGLKELGHLAIAEPVVHD